MNKVEYYSADIAHQKSQDNYDHNVNTSLNKIFNMYITPAIDKGLFSVNVPCELIDEVVNLYLREELGYQVKNIQSGLNEFEYVISW
jgi:hypothetical protein